MTARTTYLAPAAVLLLALGLRLYAIERQSLWYDEGLTVALVQRAPGEIMRAAAADVHPPLFYLALHGWVRLFGAGEGAVRSFSAVCGALAAALTAVLGRRWFGAAAGALAGLAAAVSPLGVYYGQEARMYALAALLAACAWLALDLWREARRTRWLALYGLAALAALLTHYFTVTVVAAAGAVGLAWLLARRPPRPRALAAWLLLHAALAAAYLPLAWGSRGALAGWSYAKEAAGPPVVAVDALRALALGPVAPLAAMQWLGLFVALLAGLALWPAPVRPWQRLMAGAWLLAPLAALALLSFGQAYYKPRFLLPALPAFHILLGAGAVALAARIAPRRHEDTETGGLDEPPAHVLGPRRRTIPLLARTCVPWRLGGLGLLLLLAAGEPLAHTYFDPGAWRDDYRGLAGTIAATARPGDAVLLVGPGQRDVLDYYLRAPLARYGLPRAGPPDPAAVERELEAIARRHRRLYGVFYVPNQADPGGVVADWLRRSAFRASSRWYGGVELAVYELGELDAPETPLDARFGAGVRLLGARVGPAELRPGDAVRLEARWLAEAPLSPLLVFAHLLDERGQIVAQYDGPPAPVGSETWAPGVEQRGRMAVLLPPDAAPGAYRLVAGLYEPAGGARLRLPDGRDSVQLATIHVAGSRTEVYP